MFPSGASARSVALVAVAIAVPLMGGCDDADQDLCSQYSGLVSAAQNWQEQDPLTASAEELSASAEEFQTEVDQFLTVAEGRLDTAILNLRAHLDAFRSDVADKGSEALEQARPELEELKSDIDKTWAVVESVAALRCDAT